MFLRGMHKGQEVDNTTEEEVKAYTKVIKEINPKQIMVYSLDRDTPEKSLHKVSVKEMEHIAGFDHAVQNSSIVPGGPRTVNSYYVSLSRWFKVF